MIDFRLRPRGANSGPCTMLLPTSGTADSCPMDQVQRTDSVKAAVYIDKNFEGLPSRALARMSSAHAVFLGTINACNGRRRSDYRCRKPCSCVPTTSFSTCGSLVLGDEHVRAQAGAEARTARQNARLVRRVSHYRFLRTGCGRKPPNRWRSRAAVNGRPSRLPRRAQLWSCENPRRAAVPIPGNRCLGG
jgi:hypothetical protein